MNTDRYINAAYRNRRWIVAGYLLVLLGWFVAVAGPMWVIWPLELEYYSGVYITLLPELPGLMGVFGWETNVRIFSGGIGPPQSYETVFCVVLVLFLGSMLLFLQPQHNWTQRMHVDRSMNDTSVIAIGAIGSLTVVSVLYSLVEWGCQGLLLMQDWLRERASNEFMLWLGLYELGLEQPLWWWSRLTGFPPEIWALLAIGTYISTAISLRLIDGLRLRLATMARLCVWHGAAAILIWGLSAGWIAVHRSPLDFQAGVFPFGSGWVTHCDTPYTVTFLTATAALWNAGCLVCLLHAWPAYTSSRGQPTCPACGYDLRGTASGTCPECGATIELPQNHATTPETTTPA